MDSIKNNQFSFANNQTVESSHAGVNAKLALIAIADYATKLYLASVKLLVRDLGHQLLLLHFLLEYANDLLCHADGGDVEFVCVQGTLHLGAAVVFYDPVVLLALSVNVVHVHVLVLPHHELWLEGVQLCYCHLPNLVSGVQVRQFLTHLLAGPC